MKKEETKHREEKKSKKSPMWTISTWSSIILYHWNKEYYETLMKGSKKTTKME